MEALLFAKLFFRRVQLSALVISAIRLIAPPESIALLSINLLPVIIILDATKSELVEFKESKYKSTEPLLDETALLFVKLLLIILIDCPLIPTKLIAPPD